MIYTNMKDILLILNIIFSAVIVALILLQGKGAGLGSAWGGGGEMFQTRRGVEKITLRLTFLFIFLFLVVGILRFFVK
jgi:protein translocase SecG subunit